MFNFADLNREDRRMTEQSYKVEGMTCAHCVAAVTEEVSRVPGAEHVEVDLEGGTLAIGGEDVDAGAVRAAVEAAGYSVV
jgi:copper chaperone CopZ